VVGAAAATVGADVVVADVARAAEVSGACDDDFAPVSPE
jgi:hypothetical protein